MCRIPFFRGASWPRHWTQVFCIAGRFFAVWATSCTADLKLPNYLFPPFSPLARVSSVSVQVSKLYHGEAHKPQKSYLNSQIMLLYLILGPRKKAASLMEKDRIRQCTDVTELKKIQIDMICLWRQLENRVGGHLLHLSLCFKCGCLNLNWMRLGIFYKGSHLEGCRFLLSVMFYYWEEKRPEELQSSGTGKNTGRDSYTILF